MAVGAVIGTFLGAIAGRPFGVPVEAATFGMIIGSVTGGGYFTVLFDNPPKPKPYPMFTFTFIYIAIGLGVAQVGSAAKDAVQVGAVRKGPIQMDRVKPNVLVAVALSSGSLGLLVGWDIRRRLRSRTG